MSDHKKLPDLSREEWEDVVNGLSKELIESVRQPKRKQFMSEHGLAIGVVVGVILGLAMALLWSLP